MLPPVEATTVQCYRNSNIIMIIIITKQCRLMSLVMRPSSLGGGRIMRRTLSVRLSVRIVCLFVIVTERHVAPPSELQ